MLIWWLNPWASELTNYLKCTCVHCSVDLPCYTLVATDVMHETAAVNSDLVTQTFTALGAVQFVRY